MPDSTGSPCAPQAREGQGQRGRRRRETGFDSAFHVWFPPNQKLGRQMVQDVKKTLLPHCWDKSVSNTSAIPPKLTFCTSTRFTHHHACPWITGGIPSASTWSPVQAALRSPFTHCFTLRSTLRQLSKDPRLCATSLPHWFAAYFVVVVIIGSRPGLSTPIRKNFCPADRRRLTTPPVPCPIGSFSAGGKLGLRTDHGYENQREPHDQTGRDRVAVENH